MSQEVSKPKNTPQSPYSAYSIIQKKRDGEDLSNSEIKWFIDSFTEGNIPDYQMSALLMAIFIQGMNVKETAALTDAMLYSGKVLEFDKQNIIDKHSTGGIGDKTSFILTPIAAACGVKVPMISGRGLGHTGGTVDKMESIPGFNTSVQLDQFARRLEETSIVMTGQTSDIAPADKKIYALRDVTGTVESIPLITASIMSKKLAEGISGIVMDIKTGSGAFMKTLSRARALSKSLRNTALRFNKNIITIISDMSQPLGHNVGNSLEIIESIETLKGKGPKDLTDLSIHLAGSMIYLAGLAKTQAQGIKKAKETIKNGTALEKFKEMIATHDGNTDIMDNYSLLPLAETTTNVLAPKNAYIKSINGQEIGMMLVELGGGRKYTGQDIDHSVGFSIPVKSGDKIKKNQTMVTIYHHPHQQDIVNEISSKLISETFKFTNNKPKKIMPLIIETQTSWSKK